MYRPTNIKELYFPEHYFLNNPSREKRSTVRTFKHAGNTIFIQKSLNEKLNPSFATKFNKSNKPQSVVSFILTFFEFSSIHGLGHVTAKRRHPLEYLLWIIALTLAIVGTIYISRESWRRYQTFPTVIALEKDYKTWNTTFPTATICPDIKLDDREISTLAKHYLPKDPNKFISFFVLAASSNYEDFMNLPDFKEVAPDKFMDVIIKAAPNLSYSFSCSYEKQGDNTKRVLAELGICYVFNSAVAVFFAPEKFHEIENPRPTNVQLLTGNIIEGEIFTQMMNISAPYRVAITGPYEIPDVATRWTVCKRNHYAIFELLALTILSSDDIRSLSVDQRKCRFYDESNLAVSKVYTYAHCRMECRINLAFQLCGCIPFFYRKIEGKPYCDIQGLKCLGKHGEYLTNLREPKTQKKVNCNCYPMCSDTFFVFEESEVMEWDQATNFKYGMVRYPKTRLKREVIFAFDNLLVSVGATAALFLGCSVLGFIEILYFFTLRLLINLIRQLHGE